MPAARLKTVTRTQGNNEAITSGRIAPHGFALDLIDVPVLVQAFRRMVRQLEFDVCEMALTTYLVAKAHGKPFTALPIFLVRGFHHGAIVHSAASRGGAPMGPSDLAGQRVGVNRGYTVTTGVWARAILADQYGLDLDQVTWVRSGDEHVAEYEPPANVVSAPPGATLDELLASGELGAVIGVEASGPDLVPLIPDPQEAALAALRTRRFYPINHLVVVRDDVLEAHPDLAPALFEAFAAAKYEYLDRLRAGVIDAPTPTDRLHLQVMAETGEDPLPYGIAPNRAMLEQLIGHAVRQHILDRAPDIDGLFAPGTREMVAAG